MRLGTLMMTTALAAILAGPVAAQSTEDGAARGQLGSYSVGDFLDLAVVTPDGTDAGRVEAVIEGADGARVLVALDDRTVALPLDALSLAGDGSERLVIDRGMEDLRRMAAFEPSGEMRYGGDARMADVMDAGGTGEDGDMAAAVRPDTAQGGQAQENETVVTTDPGRVAAEAADGQDIGTAEDQPGMAGAQEDSRMAGDEPGRTGANDVGTAFAGMTVGEILGMDVVGADGADVGEIDYVFENRDGYMAVIGVGGFLGLGEHTVAVPLGDFSLDGAGNVLTLQGRTEADLKAMPEIDEAGLEGLGNDHEIRM